MESAAVTGIHPGLPRNLLLAHEALQAETGPHLQDGVMYAVPAYSSSGGPFSAGATTAMAVKQSLSLIHRLGRTLSRAPRHQLQPGIFQPR